MRPHASWLTKSAALILGLLVCFTPLPPREGERASSGLAMRLFGPIAALAASAQWVRADVAFRSGRVELFLARAETALALDPDSADGWMYLARHQAYTLGSPEREPDPARRLVWIQAGLATEAEGERVSSRPADLALDSGVILLKSAWGDPGLPWPGGLAAVFDTAALHFERAGRLGFDAQLAADLSSKARAAADNERSRQ